jgi:hypothetical protein
MAMMRKALRPAPRFDVVYPLLGARHAGRNASSQQRRRCRCHSQPAEDRQTPNAPCPWRRTGFGICDLILKRTVYDNVR